jgi:hypothetical protein
MTAFLKDAVILGNTGMLWNKSTHE